jgi:predicted anti-sigma-YlaC factor YlaD
MGAVRTAECERARSWASLALDDELSEIEQASLRAHLGRCAACARFEGDLDALTRELRAAPPERPAVVVMLPRRRSGVVRGLQFGSAAAAAVMLAAGLGSLAGSLSSRNTVTLTTASPSGGNFGVLFDRGLDRGGIVAMAPTQRLPASRIHRPVAL